MRWLILAVALTGCTGAIYEAKSDDQYGLRRMHDFEMCGGGDYIAAGLSGPLPERTHACMTAKGYTLVPGVPR